MKKSSWVLLCLFATLAMLFNLYRAELYEERNAVLQQQFDEAIELVNANQELIRKNHEILSTRDSIIELQQQAITSLELQLKYYVDVESQE